jgi:hypothetical protein
MGPLMGQRRYVTYRLFWSLSRMSAISSIGTQLERPGSKTARLPAGQSQSWTSRDSSLCSPDTSETVEHAKCPWSVPI